MRLLHFYKGKDLEEKFWNWFQRNEYALFNFEEDPKKVFSQLNSAIKKVHPNLTFVFGPKKAGCREFIISADGIKDAFGAVERLYATRPNMPHWKFIKFRPRGEPDDIHFGDVILRCSDVQLTIHRDGQKVGLTVFVRGYERESDMQIKHAVYLLLDHTIGEYDVEKKVGFIEFQPYEALSAQEKIKLTELPGVLDRFIKEISSTE